jgi:hypothetical protein
MWQPTAFFLLGAALTLAGAYAAHSLAASAESAAGDTPTLASRFWWVVVVLSLAYAAGCVWLAWLRDDDDEADDGKGDSEPKL